MYDRIRGACQIKVSDELDGLVGLDAGAASLTGRKANQRSRQFSYRRQRSQLCTSPALHAASTPRRSHRWKLPD